MALKCWDAGRNTPRPPIPPCPRCGATHVVRNGLTHSGTPGFRCRGATGGSLRTRRPDRSRRPRRIWCGACWPSMGIRAIARAVGVSRSWLQGFVNELYRQETPRAGTAPKSAARS
ncbi:transposase-like zinc-binding domain-containing protein [Gemmata palustris]